VTATLTEFVLVLVSVIFSRQEASRQEASSGDRRQVHRRQVVESCSVVHFRLLVSAREGLIRSA
jgi:hypothetical protein